MSSGWKDILEASGDATVGQTLVRLAKQAAAAHRTEVALAARESMEDESAAESGRPAVGGVEVAAVHKEVDR